MSTTEHLSLSQVRAYVRGALHPSTLLGIDDHLESCAACRAALARESDASFGAEAFACALAAPETRPESPHLTFDHLRTSGDEAARGRADDRVRGAAGAASASPRRPGARPAVAGERAHGRHGRAARPLWSAASGAAAVVDQGTGRAVVAGVGAAVGLLSASPWHTPSSATPTHSATSVGLGLTRTDELIGLRPPQPLILGLVIW